MRGFVFVTKLWIFGLCWLSISCSDKELSFRNVEDNSKVKFSSGTKSGVVVNSSGNLTIDTDSLSGVSLDSSWTPKYDNIVGYWKMDGDWTDSSGNGNDGVSSGVSFSTTAVVNTGGKFVRLENDYLSLGFGDGNVSTDPITVSLWVNTNNSSDQRMYFSAGHSGLNRLYIGQNGSKYSVGIQATGWGTLNSTMDVETDAWAHLVLVLNGSQAQFYVNGNYEGAIAYTAFVFENDFELGRHSTSPGIYDYDGFLDEAVIWSSALDSSDVRRIYSTQRPKFLGELDSDWAPQWSHLVAYWRLDGNWLDSSGGEYDGSAIGGAMFSADAKVGIASGDFDGIDDEVEVNHSAALDQNAVGSSSYGFWIKADAVPVSSKYIIEKRNGGTIPFWGAYVNSTGNICIEYYSSVGWVTCALTAPLVIEAWTHVVVTRNISNSTLSLYLDGALTQVSSDIKIFADLSNSGPITIGDRNLNDSSFDGKIDEIYIWSTALTSTEVSEIYHRQKQKYVGSFESHVFDFGTAGSWAGLDIVTPLPFLKELPGQNGSESSSVYSDLVGSGGSIGDDNLMDGLLGLWHFEGGTSDSSGSGIIATDTSIGFNAVGQFGQSLELSGSGSYVSLGDNFNFPSGAAFTHSIWFKAHSFQDYRGLFTWSANDGQRQDYTCLVHSNKKAWCEMWRDHTGTSFGSGSMAVAAGEWNHLVFINDGVDASVYYNGQHIETKTAKILKPMSDIFFLGTRDGGWDFDGELDEYGVWSRALSSSEILQLYRRGANRLKYQVRSCAQSDCSDGVWKGPGGDGTTYYSELFNRLSSNFSFSCSLNTTDSDSSVCVDDEISLLGSPLVIAPSLLFRDMAGSATLDRNRYFQFKVLMESDDENNLCSSSPCLPELKSLKVRLSP